MKRIINKLILLTLAWFIIVPAASGQQARVIREAAYGVEFTAPEGWQYQRNEMGYIMGHNSIAGLIIVTSSPYTSLAEMRQGAAEGIVEEGGTALQLSSEIKPFGQNGLAAMYEGTMEGQAAKAYVIGLLNPMGAEGASCMIITTPGLFGNEHIAALESLAGSFKFFEAEVPDVVKEWEQRFKTPGGCRLKYLYVSTSTDYSGGYAGGSTEETIDLCPNGTFGFSAGSDYSMDNSAGFGYSLDSDAGQGKWELQFNGNNAVLVLNFNNGRVMEYELTYEDGKTYLSGSRYFVLFDDKGPGCY